MEVSLVQEITLVKVAISLLGDHFLVNQVVVAISGQPNLLVLVHLREPIIVVDL